MSKNKKGKKKQKKIQKKKKEKKETVQDKSGIQFFKSEEISNI
jgi:hypothetical protein